MKLYTHYIGDDYHGQAEDVCMADNIEEAAKKLGCAVTDVKEFNGDVYHNNGCDC